MHYLAYDLVVRTELKLSGGIVLSEDDPRVVAGVDVEIVEGAVSPEVSAAEPNVVLGPYRLSGDRLVFDMPGVARYCCEAGARIIVDRKAGVADHGLHAHLIATALPALLWMRGDVVLHAAVACLPGSGGAIAIGGRSGCGKSTVLDALYGAGADIVADDTICVRADGSKLMASGLAGGYFLSDVAEDKGVGRPFNEVPTVRQRRSAELTTFVMLGQRKAAGEVELGQVHGVGALEILLASRHRPRVPTVLGRNAEVLQDLARLSTALSVHRWKRVEGAPTIDSEEIAQLRRYC